jgi:hypothetical protein
MVEDLLALGQSLEAPTDYAIAKAIELIQPFLKQITKKLLVEKTERGKVLILCCLNNFKKVELLVSGESSLPSTLSVYDRDFEGYIVKETANVQTANEVLEFLERACVRKLSCPCCRSILIKSQPVSHRKHKRYSCFTCNHRFN